MGLGRVPRSQATIVLAQHTTTPLQPAHSSTPEEHHCTSAPVHHYTSTPVHHCSQLITAEHQSYTTPPLHHYASAQLHQCTSTPLNQCTTAASSQQYIRGEQLHWCSHSKLPHSSAVRGNVLHSYTTTTTDIHGGVLIHGALMYLPPFILTGRGAFFV